MKDKIVEILKKYNYEYNHYIIDGYKNKNNEVFHFGFGADNKFYMAESCDNWFDMKLDSKKCIEISNLFKELSNVVEG